ncbi:MAG: NPCBM/NEW2 domain-containing protein [Planctomycetes bacterium]|nr:NPCBM/NEW2 domain-containing protein [Planctomycetota bacterium]
MRVLLALALLVPPATPRVDRELLVLATDVTLITAEGLQIQARAVSIAEASGHLTLEYADASDRKQTIRCADVVEVVFGRLNPRTKFVPEDVVVTTATGDTLHGTISGALLGSDNKPCGVKLATGPFGDVDFLFEELAVMRFLNNKAFWPRKEPVFAKKSDHLVTKTSDVAEGTILSLAKTGVEYYSSRLRRNQTVPLDHLAMIVFMPPQKAPPAAPDTLHAIVSTTDGSTIQGLPVELKSGVLVLKDLRGTTYRVSTASVASLHFKNGRVVYVSDLQPSKVEENANFIRPEDGRALPSDLVYPWQADRSAAGTKLSIRGREFRKGIGVRAYSSLTYALQSRFRKFQASIGLDDALEHGDVVFEVWVDGRKSLSHPSKSGDATADIEVDVSGAGELRLVVDFGGNANIGDFADWGSARLVKE